MSRDDPEFENKSSRYDRLKNQKRILFETYDLIKAKYDVGDDILAKTIISIDRELSRIIVPDRPIVARLEAQEVKRMIDLKQDIKQDIISTFSMREIDDMMDECSAKERKIKRSIEELEQEQKRIYDKLHILDNIRKSLNIIRIETGVRADLL